MALFIKASGLPVATLLAMTAVVCHRERSVAIRLALRKSFLIEAVKVANWMRVFKVTKALCDAL